MIQLVILPPAEGDIDDSVAWYEQQREGLGLLFVEDLNTCFERICTLPEQYPMVVENLQRALLRRFPYAVYFLVSGNEATVIALLHQHRDQSAWRARFRAGS